MAQNEAGTVRKTQDETTRSHQTTPQHPIGSGFGAETTAAEVIRGIDLSGEIAIVTGGYSDIGLETTRTILSAGAKVVVAGRDLCVRQRNAPSASEARVMKWGNERKTHA